MPHSPAGVGDAGADVVRFQFRQFTEHLRRLKSGFQQVQHIGHPDAHSAHTRASPVLSRLENAWIDTAPGDLDFEIRALNFEPVPVSKKSAKIAELIASQQGRALDAHYLGFFECFNRQWFYEAHDVLEELWLAQGKAGANYSFYKGLIQLAGAFVHLQKDRLRPAVALFNLADANLRKYPHRHEHLDTLSTLALIEDWRGRVEAGAFVRNPLTHGQPPRLALTGIA